MSLLEKRAHLLVNPSQKGPAFSMPKSVKERLELYMGPDIMRNIDYKEPAFMAPDNRGRWQKVKEAVWDVWYTLKF